MVSKPASNPAVYDALFRPICKENIRVCYAYRYQRHRSQKQEKETTITLSKCGVTSPLRPSKSNFKESSSVVRFNFFDTCRAILINANNKEYRKQKKKERKLITSDRNNGDMKVSNTSFTHFSTVTVLLCLSTLLCQLSAPLP
jgi:hypothetical protein